MVFVLPTPGRLKANIERAEALEAELDSLPSFPPQDTSSSDESLQTRPRYGYDVGVQEISHNTTIPSSNRTGFVAPNHSSGPAQLPIPVQRPPKETHVPIQTERLTSTPGFRNRDHIGPGINKHSNRWEKQNHPQPASPNASRISPNEEAEHGREHMVIISSSASGTDSDARYPSRINPRPLTETSDSEEEADLSRKSLGDIDFAELDDYEPGIEVNHSQKFVPAIHPTFAPGPSRSCPSPSASAHSSSQSTLIADSPGSPPRIEHRHLTSGMNNKSASFRTSVTHLSSPGVGRRDSPRGQHSYSIEDLRSHVTGDDDLDFATTAKNSSNNRSSPPEVELGPTRSSAQDQPLNPYAYTATAKRRSLVVSSLKFAQPATLSRFAKLTRTPRHLAEVAEDTSELSALPIDRPRSQSISQDSVSVGNATDSTNYDLTTYGANKKVTVENSTAPVGSNETQRFNKTKLNSFLHTLNTQLTAENDRMTNQLNEAHRELRLLRNAHNNSRRTPQASGNSAQQTREENGDDSLTERSEALINHLEAIVENQNHITGLQSKIIDVRSELDGDLTTAASSRTLILERQIKRLQRTVEEQNVDLTQMRNQLMTAASPAASEKLQENFRLNDELVHMEEELGAKEDEIIKLKMEHIESAGHNASTVNSLRAELQQAQNRLAQTERELTEAKLATESVTESFASKIDALKTQVADLMGEQDDRLASTSYQLQQARQLIDVQAKELNQLKSDLANSGQQLTILKSEKSELQKILNGKSPSEVLNQSAERRLNLLQTHAVTLEGIIAGKEKAAQDKSFLATQAAEQHALATQRLNKQIEDLQKQITDIAQELADKTMRVQHLEESLAESERTRTAQNSEMANLQSQIDLLEADATSHKSTIKGLEVRLTRALQSAFPSPSSENRRSTLHPAGKQQADQASPELNEARLEIAHLKACLGGPDAIADSEIKDLKIKTLENHCHELEERVKALRHQASALSSTPSRSYAFKSIMSMRTPKTPNQFLANITNSANDSAASDETIVPVLSQIRELQQQVEQLRRQLDLANSNVDSKLEKLAEAGANAVHLSTQLLTARSRIQELETRLDGLVGDNGMFKQVEQRLSSLNCPNCANTFDANRLVKLRTRPEANEPELTSAITEEEPGSKSVRSSAQLQELAASNRQFQSEIDRLTRELDAKTIQLEELRSNQEEDERENAELQDQLHETQFKLNALQNDLKALQQRHREALSSQKNASEAQQELEERLKEAENRLSQTEQELSTARKAQNSLDAELRALHEVKGNHQDLTDQNSQLKFTIQELECEKTQAADQITSLNEQIATLRRECDRKNQMVTHSEKSYHRVQTLLETQSEELTDLKTNLEAKSQEITRLKELKEDLLKDAKSLRGDLLRVKTEAQDLQQDLKQLRSQANSKPNSDLEGVSNLGPKKPWTAHRGEDNCGRGSRDEIATRHNSECKGLLLRIRFLKLMYTRENIFRADLSIQKRLLMIKLAETENRNEVIQVTLEKFGLPSAPCPGNFTIHSPDRSFKGISLAIQAIFKMRILSRNWKTEERTKKKLKEAYREVRGREFVDE